MAETDFSYRLQRELVGFPQPPRYVNGLSEMPRWERYQSSMLHRFSLYIHRERTKAIAGQIAYFALEDPPTLTELIELDSLSNHHDDHELIDTDKPSPDKEDMTPEEKEIEYAQELASFEIVGRKYLGLDDTRLPQYMDAMADYQKKDRMVPQIVDVADKLDAVGEVINEIRCGNLGFIDAYLFYRNRRLKYFEAYPFWERLKQDPAIGFDPMPSVEELVAMPRLRVDDLKSRETLKYDMYDTSLPAWYRSWLGISYDLFKDEPQPEFHMFPGWKNELRLRWNYPKKKS